MTPWWCHALEMIVCNKILLKSSLDYNQNDLGSNDLLMKKKSTFEFEQMEEAGPSWMIYDTKFMRDGPASENHYILNDPMRI